MKHTVLGLFAAALLMVPTAFAAKMVCKDTGKEVKACCCEIKNGKFVCKLDKEVFRSVVASQNRIDAITPADEVIVL